MILCMSDYPRTLLEFQKLFPDEAACASHLERIRWPEGFKCPYCSQVGDLFWPMVAFDSVLKIATRVESLTYMAFYEDAKTHTNPAGSDDSVLTG